MDYLNTLTLGFKYSEEHYIFFDKYGKCNTQNCLDLTYLCYPDGFIKFPSTLEAKSPG